MHRLPARPAFPRRTARPQAGFTLVEMLVALAIFVILATLTLASFRGVSKNDQISAASNQVKGWFERARSKAIHDKLPRGVRFLPDANKRTYCTSAVFIGSAGYDEGDFSAALPAQRKFVVLNSTARLTLSASEQTATEWFYLINSQALSAATAQTHGLRCELPRGSGYWYPIVNVVAQLTPTPQATMTLGRPVLNTIGGINEPLDYRVELGPTVLEDEPIALPRGIVIDMDASIIPSSWRPGFDTVTSKWDVPSDRMDIMFTPQGTFGGQLAASTGVLHLMVSTLEDADAARLPPNTHPEDFPGPPPRPAAYSYPFVLANPKTTQKVVSVFTNSGRVSTSDVFIYAYNASSQPVIFDSYAAGGFNNLRLDTSFSPLVPFRNAVIGKEVK